MPVLIIIAILNFTGLYLYSNWHFTGVAHKQQALVDFICPIGCILGRILFKFDMKTNKFAYIYGLIFEIFVFIIFSALF